MEGVELFWVDRPGETADVIVDGFRAPYLQVRRLKGGPEDGRLSVSLHRPGGGVFLSIDVGGEGELQNWLPMVANAMAISAGYTCHGPGSRPLNPFRGRVHTITSAEES